MKGVQVEKGEREEDGKKGEGEGGEEGAGDKYRGDKNFAKSLPRGGESANQGLECVRPNRPNSSEYLTDQPSTSAASKTRVRWNSGCEFSDRS